MKNPIRIHCTITGKVQGVWFRASTKDIAEKLGVTGWVRNLPDGGVEVMAAGEKERVDDLRVWLQQGPRTAQVTRFDCEELPWEEYPSFEVR